MQDEYEWLWLYAAVEPTTGTGVFLLLPTVEGQCLEIFLQHLRHELGEGPIGVVLDSSGSHRSGEVSWPQDMYPLYLPPYSPERESRRADLPASAQAPLHCHFHDARRVAKRAHRRTPAALGASDGGAPPHRLSLVGRGRQHEHIIQFLKQYYSDSVAAFDLNDDIACSDLASCATPLIRAKLEQRVHQFCILWFH